jgi:hypothetical protein
VWYSENKQPEIPEGCNPYSITSDFPVHCLLARLMVALCVDARYELLGEYSKEKKT